MATVSWAFVGARLARDEDDAVIVIVPTLPRGNAARDAPRSALEVTQSVTGCITTQSVGTIMVYWLLCRLSQFEVIQRTVGQQLGQLDQLLNAQRNMPPGTFQIERQVTDQRIS